MVKVSKRLSYLLRHCTEPLYVDLNGGWADVDVILDALRAQFKDVDRGMIEEIVAQDAKGRYSFDSTGRRIRANQGHSIAGVVIEFEEPEPPEFLYHGTATRFLDDVMREGLKPMSRQYVHISSDYDTAVEIGKRHGKPVILRINAQKFVEDGHKLYRSSNGVWLAESVPAEYFEVVEEGRSDLQ